MASRKLTAITAEESRKRVARLRSKGYRVKRVKTPFGTVVLVSKKPFVCRKSHCAIDPKGKRAPSVDAMRKADAKRTAAKKRKKGRR